MAVSVNVVVLAGTIAADPVERRMPSGEECTEIRLSVPDPGKRLLPLPVVAPGFHRARRRPASSDELPSPSVGACSARGRSPRAVSHP
jgi:hypothetical protein